MSVMGYMLQRWRTHSKVKLITGKGARERRDTAALKTRMSKTHTTEGFLGVRQNLEASAKFMFIEVSEADYPK